MDRYDELAADIIDIVLEKIEELYPELKPRKEFLDESINASILFGEAYYNVEGEILILKQLRLNLRSEKHGAGTHHKA